MELYEIKNGLEDARLLLDQLYVSANIEVLKREIEGLTVQISRDAMESTMDAIKLAVSDGLTIVCDINFLYLF